MKSFFRPLKAIGAGSLAALLLVAATGNRVALGAAHITPTASRPAPLASTVPQAPAVAKLGGYFTEVGVGGQYPGDFPSFTIGSSSSTALLAAPAYRTTDFSAFD